MKVKCISNFVKSNKKHYEVKVGKEYYVLSIMFKNEDPTYVTSSKFDDCAIYRIIDEYGNLMPFPSQLFNIVEQSIPINWIIKKYKNKTFDLIPKEWDYDNFWEDYYNDEPNAIEKVKKQQILMLKNYSK